MREWSPPHEIGHPYNSSQQKIKMLSWFNIPEEWLLMTGKTLTVQGECCDNLQCVENACIGACAQHVYADQTACQF